MLKISKRFIFLCMYLIINKIIIILQKDIYIIINFYKKLMKMT